MTTSVASAARSLGIAIAIAVVVAAGAWLRWGHAQSIVVPEYARFGVLMVVWVVVTGNVADGARSFYARTTHKGAVRIAAFAALAAIQVATYFAGKTWVSP
jgi:hypothetical protein